MGTKELRSMSKAEELAHLHELYESDSYFRNTITLPDYNQMVSNIQNDHPLLLNTSLGIANHAWNTKNEFDIQTAKLPMLISFRKIMHKLTLPKGAVIIDAEVEAIQFFLHDVYGEGKLECLMYINTAGTDYVLKAGTTPMPLKNYSDQFQGFARLYEWISNHTSELYSVIGGKLHSMQIDDQDFIEI